MRRVPRYPRYFHIGVPKSGTTTLQRVLGADPRIHLARSRHFNTSRFYVEPYPEAPTDRLLVESDETLVKGDGTFAKAHVTLARIHEASPDAHIILTIREQRSLLLSAFKHNLRAGLPEGTLTDFLRSPRGTDFIAFTQYATLLELIGLYFPHDHVHVVPFEWLRDDPARFFGGVYGVLELSPPTDLRPPHANASPEAAQLELLGRLGRLRRAGTTRTLPRRAVAGLRKLGDIGDRVSGGALSRAARERFSWGDDELCRALAEEHREQNRRVAAQTGLDLAALGYLV
jgi:hypothetical protein